MHPAGQSLELCSARQLDARTLICGTNFRRLRSERGWGDSNLKTFRATRATDWLRPKELGGWGYDIQTVRDLLGHDADSESIWSYLRAVDKEIIVADINKQQEEAEQKRRQIELSMTSAVSLDDGALRVSGVVVAHGFPLAP